MIWKITEKRRFNRKQNQTQTDIKIWLSVVQLKERLHVVDTPTDRVYCCIQPLHSVENNYSIYIMKI